MENQITLNPQTDKISFFQPKGSPMAFIRPMVKSCYYEPKEDITVYELALITPILIAWSNGQYFSIEENPHYELIKRHFRIG